MAVNTIKFLDKNTNTWTSYTEGTPEFQAAILNPDLLPEENKDFQVMQNDGTIGMVSTSEKNNASDDIRENNLTLPTTADIYKDDAARDPLGGIKATLAGLARGFTFGLSDVAINAITPTSFGSMESLKALEEAYPVLSGGANIIGSIVSPVSKIGMATKGASLAVKAGRMAAAGAIEGAGQEVSDIVLENKPLLSATAGANIAKSTLLSGLLGAGIPMAGAGAKVMAPMAGSFANNTVGKLYTGAKSLLPETPGATEAGLNKLRTSIKNLRDEANGFATEYDALKGGLQKKLINSNIPKKKVEEAITSLDDKMLNHNILDSDVRKQIRADVAEKLGTTELSSDLTKHINNMFLVENNRQVINKIPTKALTNNRLLFKSIKNPDSSFMKSYNDLKTYLKDYSDFDTPGGKSVSQNQKLAKWNLSNVVDLGIKNKLDDITSIVTEIKPVTGDDVLKLGGIGFFLGNYISGIIALFAGAKRYANQQTLDAVEDYISRGIAKARASKMATTTIPGAIRSIPTGILSSNLITADNYSQVSDVIKSIPDSYERTEDSNINTALGQTENIIRALKNTLPMEYIGVSGRPRPPTKEQLALANRRIAILLNPLDALKEDLSSDDLKFIKDTNPNLFNAISSTMPELNDTSNISTIQNIYSNTPAPTPKTSKMKISPPAQSNIDRGEQL